MSNRQFICFDRPQLCFPSIPSSQQTANAPALIALLHFYAICIPNFIFGAFQCEKWHHHRPHKSSTHTVQAHMRSIYTIVIPWPCITAIAAPLSESDPPFRLKLIDRRVNTLWPLLKHGINCRWHPFREIPEWNGYVWNLCSFLPMQSPI